MTASNPICVDMTLTKLQDEVSGGRYVFAQPLTVVALGVQNKYVFYKACTKCPKRLTNHVCAVHGYQHEHVNRFALRVLLTDSIGCECWCSCFDTNAVKILGFTANDYALMDTDEQRYESMSTLRGSQVAVVIRKRVTGEYVNYIAEEINIINM